ELMEKLKKVLWFISSMRFAIILLVIMAAACSVGSLVTQNQTYAWYAAVEARGVNNPRGGDWRTGDQGGEIDFYEAQGRNWKEVYRYTQNQ
ncbi:MAG: hypothetical protein II178_04395, partial [Selenomonadaceae bacterium]|nr:hypothetical protein [Selenomonadaceae bacterium]